jgi:hypothetical protein
MAGEEKASRTSEHVGLAAGLALFALMLALPAPAGMPLPA